jgi:hypothetical protein
MRWVAIFGDNEERASVRKEHTSTILRGMVTGS